MASAEIQIESQPHRLSRTSDAQSADLISPELHPLVSKAKLALEPFGWGLSKTSFGNLDMRIGEDSIPRALLIWDGVIRGLERLGHSVVVKDYRYGRHATLLKVTEVQIGGERLKVDLNEPIRHLSPPEELTDEAARMAWVNEMHAVPSGRLVFAVRGSGFNRYRPWSDRGKTKLENQIDSIVSGLIEVAQGASRKRAEFTREEEARLERERREEWERGRAHRNAEWARRVQTLLTQRRDAVELRELIAELERVAPRGTDGALDPEFAEWATWAREHADELDPVRRMEAGQPWMTGGPEGTAASVEEPTESAPGLTSFVVVPTVHRRRGFPRRHWASKRWN